MRRWAAGPQRGPPRVAGKGWGERDCVPHQGHCPQRHKKSVDARRGPLQTLQRTRHAPAGPWVAKRGLVCSDSDSCAPLRDRAGRGQRGLWRQCAPSLAHTASKKFSVRHQAPCFWRTSSRKHAADIEASPTAPWANGAREGMGL